MFKLNITITTVNRIYRIRKHSWIFFFQITQFTLRKLIKFPMFNINIVSSTMRRTMCKIQVMLISTIINLIECNNTKINILICFTSSYKLLNTHYLTLIIAIVTIINTRRAPANTTFTSTWRECIYTSYLCRCRASPSVHFLYTGLSW